MFHSDETFMCFIQMRLSCVQVFISNKIYKKPVTFFKMVLKIVFITKCNKKLFEMHYSLEKNCLLVPQMVTPSPLIKIMVRP